MALRTENLISTLFFELDRQSAQKALSTKDKLEGDVRVGVDVDSKGFNRNIGGFNKGLKGLSVLGVATGNVIADAFVAATQAIGGTVEESVRLAAEAEQTEIAFSTFLGSTEKARDVIADLEQFSLSTPFTPDQILNSGRALLAFGEPVEGLVDTIGRLGDISAGVNVPVENLAELYGKARIAGTLFAEDINQLTGLGVDVITEFSQQLGVSTSEVKKLASEGKITFENLEEAVESLTGSQGQFFELTSRQATSVGGLFSTIQGAFGSLQKSLGETILPLAREVLPRLISGLFQLVEVARNAADDIASFFIGLFRVIGQVLDPLVDSVRRFFARFSEGEGVLKKLQPLFTFFARVLTLISIRISRVIDAFGNLIEFFRGQAGSNSVIGRFINSLIDAFTNLPAVINGVYSVIEALPAAVANVFNRTLLEARAFVSDLGTVLNPINLGRAIANGFDSLDFSAGNALRAQADEIKSFGVIVADAYEEGFNEINDVEFELPEIVKPEGIERAAQSGEKLGDAVVEGAKKSIEEKLPAGSLAALKKALSELETELSQVASVSAFEGQGIDTLREKIQEIADKREEIELLESVLDRIGSEQLGALDSLTTIGGVEIEDTEAQRIFDRFREQAEEVDKKGLFSLTTEELDEVRSTASQVLDISKQLTNDLLSQAIERKDNEISIQEDRLNAVLGIADRGNAEQVQLEEERLRKLNEEREKYVRQQRQLAAAQIAIENAVAIAGAVRLIATSTNPVDIALRSVLVAATIASTISTLSGAFGDVPSFYKGTESVPGATTKGTLIEAHGKERILTARQNAPLLKLGVKNNDIPSLVEMGLMMQSTRIPPELLQIRPDETLADLRKQNREIKKELKLTRQAISNLRVSQSIDGRGVRQMVDTEQRKVERRKNLRR